MLTLMFAVAVASPPHGVSPEHVAAAGELEARLGPGRWTTPAPPAIVNGSVVDYAPNRVVALALVDPENGAAYSFCTGSLIAARWVLTAAHCLMDLDTYYVDGLVPHIVWGVSARGHTDAIPWASSVTSPSYVSRMYINDAGLVELAEPKEEVQWMVLNDAPVDETWIDTDLTFFGYGLTSDLGGSSGTLREVIMPIANVDRSNLYTFHHRSNVCYGDSGGPSVLLRSDGEVQVGINAYLTSASCEGGGSGSTRVDNHLEWIREHVPEVLTDPADLPFIDPVPEPVVAVEDDRDADWVDDVYYREPEAGCATARPRPGTWLGAMSRRR